MIFESGQTGHEKIQEDFQQKGGGKRSRSDGGNSIGLDKSFSSF